MAITLLISGKNAVRRLDWRERRLGREVGEGWRERKGKVFPVAEVVGQGGRLRRCRVVR